MPSLIETAQISDIKELYDLQLRAFESEAEMIGSRNVPALMESFEDNQADFPNWTYLIKRDNTGSIIAAVRFREQADILEIGRLMVSPNHRHQGLATELMLAVEPFAKNKPLELYTCTKSWINIKLYEKLGYTIYKEEKGQHDLTFAYMRKS